MPRPSRPPWRVVPPGVTKQVSAYRVQANGELIALCRWHPRTAEAKARAEANAYLIAASPKMLKALRACLTAIAVARCRSLTRAAALAREAIAATEPPRPQRRK